MVEAVKNTESKSMLAKLLATENIKVQHKPGIKTAMFDLENRVLILPIWTNISSDLEDLLLGHETGHALDTPTGQYKDAIDTITKNVFGNTASDRLKKTVAGFLNVIEDARIDKRQKRRYPGLKRNYLNGYKELIDRNFFGTDGRPLESFNFIDRANLYFKGGNVHLYLNFTTEEKVLLKKIENLESFDETVMVTEEVYRFCKDQIEQQLKDGDLEFGSCSDSDDSEYDEFDGYDGEKGDSNDFDYDSDDSDGDSSNSGDPEEGEGDEEGSGSGSGEEGEEEEEGLNKNRKPSNSGKKSDDKEKDSKQNQSRTGKGAGQSNNEIAPSVETNDAYERKIQTIVKNTHNSYVYVNFPEVNLKKAINDYKVVLDDWKKRIVNTPQRHAYYDIMTSSKLEEMRVDFTKWRMQEKETISFMVSEFERKKAAEMYARTSIARTGVIDMNKVHSYKFNEDLFRRVSTIPKGKNHGFVMFLDWSGSMHGNLKETIKQLLSMVLFCKQIQVPFDVYAFKDAGAELPFKTRGINDCVQFQRVVLRNFLSSRMNTQEFNFAASVLWGIANGRHVPDEGMGGTPLNDAIVIAPYVVNEFRKKHKLEIVNTIFLTDGDSNSTSGTLANDTNTNKILGGRREYFFNDPMTGKTYELSGMGYFHSGDELTNTLLKILKDRTQSNLIGFFLFDGGYSRFSRRYNMGHNIKAKTFWNENKFYPVKSEGYDEYYVIDTDAMVDTDNVLDITDANASVKSMTKAFSKFSAKKTVNRVLLRQFIQKISGEEEKKKKAV